MVVGVIGSAGLPTVTELGLEVEKDEVKLTTDTTDALAVSQDDLGSLGQEDATWESLRFLIP